MTKIDDSRFYKAEDDAQLRFFQMPKVLFTNPKYKGLSLAAKATFAILRDKQDLSTKSAKEKGEYIDENGYIYQIYRVDKLASTLSTSAKTAIKYKKELIKYGLLFEKRMGQGRANRIYVLKPEYGDSDMRTKKETYGSTGNTVKCKKYTSKSVKNTSLEVKKIHTIDTNISEIEYSDTESVSQFPKGQNSKQTDRPTDKKQKPQIIAEQIISQAQTHLQELQDQALIEGAIDYLLSLRELRTKDAIYSSEAIRRYLSRLSLEMVDSILRKYKTAYETGLTNPAAYLNTLIINTIREWYALNPALPQE